MNYQNKIPSFNFQYESNLKYLVVIKSSLVDLAPWLVKLFKVPEKFDLKLN